MMGLIELNVPVARDDKGYWHNPALPDFNEDHATYRAWLHAQGLETAVDLLEHEPDHHPAYVDYYEHGGNDVSQWHCVAPVGDGWHTLSIHDSEDGPCWLWARRIAAVTEGA